MSHKFLILLLAATFGGCQLMPDDPELKKDIEKTFDRVIIDVLDDQQPAAPPCNTYKKFAEADDGGDVDVVLKR